jgi:hypothetical protein
VTQTSAEPGAGHVVPAAATTSNTAAVYNVDRIRYVRAMAPNREVQRLALDLDGARISVRMDGGRASVGVVSDPDNTLGSTWVRQVERTIDQTVRASASSTGDSGAGNDGQQGSLGSDAQQRRAQAQGTWAEHSTAAISGLRWASRAQQLAAQQFAVQGTSDGSAV